MFQVPAPNHTQTPNILFDEWLPHLGMAELKVLMVIMRKTFGWHKVRDRISLSQLEVLTGLERRHVTKARKSLVEKGLISKVTNGEKGQEETYYELVVIENSNKNYQCPKDPGTGVLKTPTKETLTKEKEKKVNKEKLPRTARQPAATPIILNNETKKFEGIEEEDIKTWQEAFPAVNIRKEIIECQLWAMSVHRNNYRKSLNKWMSNVNKTHTTPFKEKEKKSPATEEDLSVNKNLAQKWEKEFSGKGGIHYAILATSQKVTFVMPNDEGYSVDYNHTKEEFEKLCRSALKKMKLN